MFVTLYKSYTCKCASVFTNHDNWKPNTVSGCIDTFAIMTKIKESEVAQSCPTLCDPVDCSPPGSPLSMEFSRQEYWSTLPFPSPGNLPNPGIKPASYLPLALPGNPIQVISESESEVAQFCPTLCDLLDCSLPGSSIHGILQARILEWVAISLSRESSWPSDQSQVSRIAGRRFNLWATREAQITLLII